MPLDGTRDTSRTNLRLYGACYDILTASCTDQRPHSLIRSRFFAGRGTANYVDRLPTTSFAGMQAI